MKLAFVIKTLGIAGGAGGAEKVLAQVASELSHRGHDISIVSFDREGDPDFYPLSPKVCRVRLGVGDASGRTSLSGMIAQILELRRHFRKAVPDVAIGFMHSAYLPLALALAGHRVPIVASEHIVYGHYRDRGGQRLLLNAMAGRFRAITAISEAVRAGFPGRLARRMVAIPNPVDTRVRRLADPVGGELKTLLSVGRLYDQKDHHTLIAAFGKVAGRFPQWSLRIVGEGPKRKMLEAQIANLGLSERITLPGKTAAIAAEYEAAQLFAMPSRYESFGLATAEALAHGLPAVGFADCPGTNELIRDGSNGLLVGSCGGRQDMLAEALHRLMDSDELRAQLAREAPSSVCQFALAAVVDQWENLLRGVAEGDHQTR